MADRKKESEQAFSVADTQPERISQDERSMRIIKAIQEMQAVERDYIGLDEATIQVNHDRPLKIYTVADLHMGSIATDYDAIIEFRDAVLADENAGLILLGDEIEGLIQKYLDSNAARTIPDVHQQIDLIKNVFIKPLAEKGKIFGMVSGYFGHPGWTQDVSTINTWMMMADEFGIPIIKNGGLLKFRYLSGHKQSIRIYHNPPGKSKYDPVFGLREAIQSISGPDAAVAGHTHRSGIAKENEPNINNGESEAKIYVNTGAYKGSNENLPPDRFGVKLGLPLADKPGQGMISYLIGNGENAKRDLWPALTTQQLNLVQLALEMMNYTESAGTTAEFMGIIQDKIAKPSTIFVDDKSKKVATPYDESPKKDKDNKTYRELYGDIVTNQYDTAFWNIISDLPISVDFVQNIREGSNSSGHDALETYMTRRFSENSYAFIAFLRNIVDMDAAINPKRKQILDNLVALGVKYPGQVLAVLHDPSLRNNAWKKSVGKENGQGPIPAGSYLANGMDAKLIRHKSIIKVAVGPSSSSEQKPTYSIMTLDKQGKSGGSTNRPTYGLSRIYDKQTQNKPGIVAGGHLAMSGFSSKPDRSNEETEAPTFVASGWWADTVDTEGEGNSGPGAIAGQSTILAPGTKPEDYIVIPTANPEETQLFHEALILLYGLQILGLTNKAHGLSKKSRK